MKGTRKWTFSDVTIKKGEYLVIFASGKNEMIEDEIHANFKLDSKGETIALSNASAKVISKVYVNETYKDTSYGYNGEKYVYYYNGTPGSENDGDRYTTKQHKETLKINGWNFCPVDIIDENGTIDLPIKNSKWFDHMTMGKNIVSYDSLIALTHFKGHAMGGFGGSNKNLGIGCADGRIGKAMIHTYPGDEQWSISEEDFMERMTESTKAIVDYFKNKITFINVMRNMSVSCDCEGVNAAPVVTPNVGILASRDICALDTACIDLIYAMKKDENHDIVERIETRHGLRQLYYMHELGIN